MSRRCFGSCRVCVYKILEEEVSELMTGDRLHAIPPRDVDESATWTTIRSSIRQTAPRSDAGLTPTVAC
jgi:hypothetical protein